MGSEVGCLRTRCWRDRVLVLYACSLLDPFNILRAQFNDCNWPRHERRSFVFLSGYQVVEGLRDTHLFPYSGSLIENAVNFSMLPQLKKSDCAIAGFARTTSALHGFIVRVDGADLVGVGVSHNKLDDGLLGFCSKSNCPTSGAGIFHGYFSVQLIHRIRKASVLPQGFLGDVPDVERPGCFVEKSSGSPNEMFGDMNLTAAPRFRPINLADLGITCDINCSWRVQRKNRSRPGRYGQDKDSENQRVSHTRSIYQRYRGEADSSVSQISTPAPSWA